MGLVAAELDMVAGAADLVMLTGAVEPWLSATYVAGRRFGRRGERDKGNGDIALLSRPQANM